MRTRTFKLVSNIAAVAMIAITLASASVHAAGFQRGFASDPEGKPLEIGIWYPSAAASVPTSIGPTTMSVALNGPIQGKGLPLVVMSHGNGGSFLSHFDTAIALADAGFIAVAVTHSGDNYADQSRSLEVLDRSRHMSRAIDYMLSVWDGQGAIDPARIGIFGMSSGGFTALASIGGLPDFSKIGPTCEQHPGDYACRLIAKSGSTEPPIAHTPVANNAIDPRIKSAVVAAPALGFTFSAEGLANVTAPVQLWRAENDVVVPHPRYAEAVRLALPRAPEYHVVPKAGHFDFLAPCGSALAAMAPAICTSATGFDRAAFHVRFNAQVVEFFSKTLQAAPLSKSTL